MLRQMLLAASASDRVRRMAVAAPYTRDVVARYVAGDDAAAAVEATRRLQADGLPVTLDYLGEDTTSAEHAAAVAAEYVALTQLQADALITLDQQLADAVRELVTVAPVEDLSS